MNAKRGTTSIRTAHTDNAEGMGRVLHEIAEVTGRRHPTDVQHVLSTYVRNAAGVRCSVAVEETGKILGFQSLIKAAAGNAYGVAEGWGIIGTHISPSAHRKGIGYALFEVSRTAAPAARLDRIDSTVGRSNEVALRYYAALGFQPYREEPEVIHLVFHVSSER